MGGNPYLTSRFCRIELDPNLHSKMVSRVYARFIKGSPTILFTHKPKSVFGCIGKTNPSLTSARDSTNIEYISGRQPSPYMTQTHILRELKHEYPFNRDFGEYWFNKCARVWNFLILWLCETAISSMVSEFAHFFYEQGYFLHKV